MKQNSIKKPLLLLLCAVAGTTGALADKTPVAIPQELGSYITWDKAATNCTVQGDGNTYVGNTNGNDKYAEFEIENSTAQSYILTFATGSTTGNTGHLNVVLTDNESKKVLEAVATVEATGGWTNFNTVNYYSLENLPVGTYTLRISVKDRTSSYCGNWSKLAFYSSTQCGLPLKSAASYLEMSTGIFNKANDNNDNVINYIRPNGYISNIPVYNDTEDYYMFNFNLDAHKGYTDGKVRLTICNAITGVQELQATADASTAGDKSIALPTKLTAGWKTVRFDFLSETAAAEDNDSNKKYLFNFRQANFSPLSQLMPLVGGTPSIFDLSVWPTSGNPRYQSEDKNLGYIYNGNSANFYFINENEEAYYNLQSGITANVDGASLKVTITDCTTGTKEVEQTFNVAKTSGYATQTFKLDNAITAGVKEIRFDFIKDAEASWLYNVKDVSFYKRSLNEDYDYTPVAASGIDVVLTRSISADRWITIVLPFAMTSEQISSAFGSGAKVAQLTSGDASSLNFSTVSETAANQPYAIKVGSNFTSATINGVTIESGTPTQTVGDWHFTGTYTNTTIPQDSYFFSSNKLYKANTAVDIKPFRAYLTYTGGGAPAPALSFIIDGNPTGIARINAEGRLLLEEGSAFNLNGQRVAQPRKGLYVVNGKKVVIK